MRRPTDAASERRLIAQIGRLYYGESGGRSRLTQAQIREREDVRWGNGDKLSQLDVSRLLEKGEKEGIIRHVIHYTEPEKLESSMKERFPHLVDVQVIPSPSPGSGGNRQLLNGLGEKCATYLLGRLRGGERLGISCGQTASSVVDAIGRQREGGVQLPDDTYIYPLMILMAPEIEGITPMALVANLVRWMPRSKGKAFQLPPDHRNGTGKTTQMSMRNHPEVIKLLTEMSKLDYYIIGIGSIDYREGSLNGIGLHGLQTFEFNAMVAREKLLGTLKRLGAVGECLYQPFNQQGQSLIDKKELALLRSKYLHLPIESLEEIARDDDRKVIAVCGGESKHGALKAALHARIFNVLITDSVTAEELLKIS